jgi:hypothetical protein
MYATMDSPRAKLSRYSFKESQYRQVYKFSRMFHIAFAAGLVVYSVSDFKFKRKRFIAYYHQAVTFIRIFA